MRAINVVRFRVKPGFEDEFVNAHRQMTGSDFTGFRRGSLVKTGDRTFCMIGEWNDFSSIEKSRDQMVNRLDGFRHMLEDLGGGLGVSDPVSGEVVLDLEP